MKKHTLIIALLVLMITTFSSCAAIEGIFKAGMGVGIFLVLVVVAIVIFFLSKMNKK